MNETRLENLCADIDMRIAEAWSIAFEVDEWTLPIVGGFMRLAYARGYHDALAAWNPEDFLLRHGYRPPRKGEQ